jgi:hypothetical protein
VVGSPPTKGQALLLHLQVTAFEGADHCGHEPVVGLVGVGTFVGFSEEVGFSAPGVGKGPAPPICAPIAATVGS